MRMFILVICTMFAAACTNTQEAKRPIPKASGIVRENFDSHIRPQDDFYRYVNGHWLDTAAIPADRSRWGAFVELGDQADVHLREIVDSLANSQSAVEAPNTEALDAVYHQQVRDFYASYMDEQGIEARGIRPLIPELRTIDGLNSVSDVTRYLGRVQPLPVRTPLGFFVAQDDKQADRYIVHLTQSGLGLPDRDYYLKDDEQSQKLRTAYKEYVRRLLDLAGHAQASTEAAAVIELETEIAKLHWTRTRNRDRDATYHRLTFNELTALAPQFDWQGLLDAAHIPSRGPFIVRQPDYATTVAQLIARAPVSTWRLYFAFHTISAAAPYMSKAFVDAHFAFYGKTLSGTEQLQPRWQRGVQATDNAVGEQLGKLYAERYFTPDAKARMDTLVHELQVAFASGIDELPWMTAPTRAEAKAKLAKFAIKIGYPSVWREYSTLLIRPDDLVGNLKRAAQFDYNRDLAKLGGPVDRTEWGMTPQTVNAYYNPSMNEIVFPAAILQPPFFNVAADDAVNYGAIGAVIGHEMSHGFDDQGRKSDGEGNLRDWWTADDAREFKARAAKLIVQYAAFSPLPGTNLNGELTLGENIGDLSGLAVAYHAYRTSLRGQEAPVIDGFTGDQRFFIGFAQIWRSKQRDEVTRQYMLVDPHSPPQFRAFGVLRNFDAFYSAFNVKAGDGMYLPPDQRVKIW